MPDTEVTPREAARLLGVSLSSVSRYAHDGTLHPRRTPGGHRRYDRAEVIALREAADARGVARTTD